MKNSIISWLEDTAKRFPDRTAFVDEKNKYTWKEVREKSLSIAHSIEAIISVGRKPVAVYMEKSADMLIAFLGIAYSGNFYSPISVDMPASRVEKILHTLKPKLFITTQVLKDNIGAGKQIGYEGNV